MKKIRGTPHDKNTFILGRKTDGGKVKADDISFRKRELDFVFQGDEDDEGVKRMIKTLTRVVRTVCVEISKQKMAVIRYKTQKCYF